MDKRIPVVVIKELSETDKILTALKNYGINCAEITFRTACAKDAIAYACKEYPDMTIGAGTVINAEQCQQALQAGAKFIVSPGLSVAVAKQGEGATPSSFSTHRTSGSHILKISISGCRLRIVLMIRTRSYL